MFQVIARKPEDIKLENECREKIKQLQYESKDDYDRKVAKYNRQYKNYKERIAQSQSNDKLSDYDRKVAKYNRQYKNYKENI